MPDSRSLSTAGWVRVRSGDPRRTRSEPDSSHSSHSSPAQVWQISPYRAAPKSWGDSILRSVIFFDLTAGDPISVGVADSTGSVLRTEYVAAADGDARAAEEGIEEVSPS